MVEVLYKWLKHFFSLGVFAIIKGNFNRLFGKKQSLFDKRYAICRHCPNREELPIVGEICGICGCPLGSKLRVEDEHCEYNNW